MEDLYSMTDEFMTLKDFIHLLTQGTRLHVCIHDVSNLLSINLMQLDYHNTIHYEDTCNFAKTTKKGLTLCLRCKALANKKAASDPKAFWGLCPWGLTEYVLPVFFDSELLCIIYLGNICMNTAVTEKCMKKATKFTGVSDLITNMIPSMVHNTNTEYYEKIAYAIKSYILLLYQISGAHTERSNTHWIVRAFLDYANAFYNKEITVADIASLYDINKKYAGRIFKKHMGMSFSQYLNKRRIQEATSLLISTGVSITDVSLECGYNNVSYFNRIFKNATGQSPNEYRKSHSKV